MAEFRDPSATSPPESHRPFHCGSRLSLNAAIPSRRSSEATARRQAKSSNSMPTSSGTSQPRSMARFASRTPAGEERQISRSEEHTSELQSHSDLVCRLLLEKKKKNSPQ